MKAELTPEQKLIQNSFAKTLIELRKGSVLTEASTELAALVKEVQRLGKPGEMKLTLKVRPNADGETLEIEASVDAKQPKPDRKATTFYPDETGGLHREDPSQKELPFGVVSGGIQEETAPAEEQSANA